MAVLANDRNEVLNSATSRIVGGEVYITTTTSAAFTVAKDASVATPSSITLSAGANKYTSPSYVWYRRIGGTGNFVLINGATSANLVISGDFQFLYEVGANSLVEYKIICTQTGVNTSEAIITIPVLREGTNAVVAGLSTSSLLLPAGSDGTVSSFAAAETSFITYNGITNATDQWSYYVSANGGGISYQDSDDSTPRTATGPADGGLGGVNLLATSNVVNAGTGTTFVANQTVGPDGTTTMGKLVASATTGGHEGSISYTWQSGTTYTLSGYIKSDNSALVNGFNGGGNSTIGSVGQMSYNFATNTGTGATFTQLQDGLVRFAVTFTPTASNTSLFFLRPTSNGSSVFTGNGTSGVFVGSLQLETGSIANEYVATNGVARSGTRGYVKIVALTQDSSYLDITATKIGYTSITRRLSVAKSKQGLPGVAGTRTAILDLYQWSSTVPGTFPTGNSTYTWATGQFTAPATLNNWTTTPGTATAGQTLYIARQIYADTGTSASSVVTWNVTSSMPISAAGSSGTNGTRTAFLEVYQWSGTVPTGFPSGTSTYTWSTGAFSAPTTPNSWSLTPGSATAGQTLYACSVRYADTGTSLTSSVTWNTTTAYAVGAAGTNGTNGTSPLVYDIITSAPVITKDAVDAATTGTYSSITIQGKKYDGNTTTNFGWVTVTANGDTEATTATDTASAVFTLSPTTTAGKSSYTIKLYNQATVTGATLLDTQVIYVVYKGLAGANGAAGAAAIAAILSNEAHVLPANAAGAVSSYTGSGTQIRVYEGATELTYDGTGTANSTWKVVVTTATNITAGTITDSGTYATVAAGSGVADATDTASILFTITGKNSAGTSFTITKQQTLSKSKQGISVTGATGQSNHRIYIASASSTTIPSTPANTVSGAAPAGWSITPVTLTAGQAQFQSDGVTPAGSTTTTWGAPYLSYFKVANLAAISADLGAVTAGSIDINSGIATIDSAGNSTFKSITIKNSAGTTILQAGATASLAFSEVGYTGALDATKNIVTSSSTAPTSPVNGDIWVDTSVTPNVTKVRVSGVWQVAANNSTEVGGTGVNVCNPRYTTFEEAALPPVSVANGTATLDTTTGFFGTKSLKLTATAGDNYCYLGSVSTDYNFPITPGKKWLVSAFVKSSVASATGQFYLRTSVAGTHYEISFTTSATANTWTRVSGIANLTADTSTLCIARVDNDAGNTVTMNFDGIMVEAVIGASTTPSPFIAPPNFLETYTGALNATYGADWSTNVVGASTVNTNISNAATTATWTGVSGTGKPSDNANNTSVDANGNIQGVSSGAGLSVSNNVDSIIRAPGGGIYVTGTNAHTGALKITLPQSWTNTMMRFTVEVYEYLAGYMCTIEIGGYNYSANTSWYNTSARVIGSSTVEYPVYFGHDGTKCCVWIGAYNETWSYPQVRVRDFFAGYSNYSRATWESGWVIGFDTTQITSGTGANQYSASVLDTLPGADWTKNSKRPANLSGLTGTEAIQNSQISITGGAITGIGTGSGTAVANSSISIGSNGALSGAGGGQVTLSGIGLDTFKVVSVGLSSTTTPNGVGAGFYNGKTGATIVGAAAMYRVVKIRRSDNTVFDVGSYNTLAGSPNPANMAAALNAINSDYIVVVFTYDEPQGNRLTAGLDAAMYRCGASRSIFGSPQFKYRSAYALIGIPGCGEGNGAEFYQGNVDSDTTAWIDASFNVISGNISGVSGNYTPKSLADYSYTGDLNATYGANWSTNVTGAATVNTNISNAATTATWTGVTGTGKPSDNANNTYVDASGNIQGVSSNAGTAVSNAILAYGTNLCYNPDFSQGTTGWSINNNPFGAVMSIGGAGADWQVNGGIGENNNTLSVQQPNATTTGYFEVVSDPIAIVGGSRYCVSAYTGAHRANVDVFFYYYDVSGTALGNIGNDTDYNAAALSGGKALSGYKRHQRAGTVPANAATAKVVLRKFATISPNGDSWMFVTRVQFEQVGSSATTAGPWTPSGVGKSLVASVSDKLSKSTSSVLSATVSVDATSGAGFRAGSLTWDASGNRTGGSGVAMTPGGIIGHNGTTTTFAIDATTGAATFNGSGTFNGNGTFSGALSAASGTFAGELQAATGTFSGTLTAGTIDITSLVGQAYQYLNAGTYTFSPGTGMTKLKVTLVGGGGGGGGGGSSGGGGGGRYTGTFTVTPGNTYTVIVGGGGAGGLASNNYPGSAGASSTVTGTGVSGATAGGGGGGGTTGGAGGSGTTAGSAGGNRNAVVDGYTGIAQYTYAGAGGASGGNSGAGGAAPSITPVSQAYGRPGGLYGGGGSGASWHGVSGTTYQPGGVGANGRAVIEVSNPNGVVSRPEWDTLTSALIRQNIQIV